MKERGFSGIALGGCDEIVMGVEDMGAGYGIFSIHSVEYYNPVSLILIPMGIVFPIKQNISRASMFLSVSSFLFFLLFLVPAQHTRIRLLQVSLLNSIPYSSYYGQQVFQWLNWKKNDQIIKNINDQSSLTFKVQHNQFSYLSYEEIQQRYLNLKVKSDATISSVVVGSSAQVAFPTTQIIMAAFASTVSVDWRRKGMVSDIKNQGICGACWAFAATAQLQSFYLMKSSAKLSLSEQQLIDCSSSYGNIGCQGGMMDNAFRYVRDYGITTSLQYPYTGITNACVLGSSSSPYSIKESKIIYSDCSALVQLLKQQPTTVVVSVNIGFIFYSSGILNSCGTDINHAIQLVGYYKDSNQAYYIGKNSWGTAWGENGFIKIDALKNGGNLCSVCAYPQYVA